MLHLHRAERADRLVEALAGVLADPLADPFAAETVAVPTRGVERWLTQRLSATLGAAGGHSDGVCANVRFPFPGQLVGGAVVAACGVDRAADPWLPERSVWPLLEVVEHCLDEPWLAALSAHLGGSGADGYQRARRFATLRHLADLFDRYGVHRPEMVRRWWAGQDGDHDGVALPTDVAWQAQLWRRLRARLGTPSPPERLPGACERLREEPGLLDLPARLSLFGLTRLPGSYLEVLRAVATGRDVHLFLLHPSPELWARIAGSPSARERVGRRREDRTAALPRNPLLATWGQDAREMQLVLTSGDHPKAQVERHHGLVGPSGSLLARLQADVRADRQPPGPPLTGEADARAVLDPEDASVRVLACHGRARQVEVLRDAILHLLADDPTLEPRDIIVMCPDIDAFAPLIHATFGTAQHASPHDPGDEFGDDPGDGSSDDDAAPADVGRPDLRVRLADRSIRQTNPVLAVVSELLWLAAARLTASQVVDLAGREPVRRRFRLDDEDLVRVDEWVAATGIGWGLNAAHRAPFQLQQLDANTWRAGLDRLLLGVAMSEDELRLVGGVLPLDDVDSADIDLAGRLAELIDRLQAAVATLSGPQPVLAWSEAIAQAADALTACSEGDDWQRAELRRLLDDVVAEASLGGRPSATPLALAEVQALLADRLRGRPTRANFRTGHLTMCTLVPMRSVPHRVVCLLGLDDGVFPRKTAPDGDDLVQRDPFVGDRDPRSEDRQLLLDAVLAATDRLVITYAGRDERTNAVRPPAVPVGELLDVIDRTARTDELDDAGRPVPARERVVVHHPLQPFDARNFTPGALVRARPWSFDPLGLEGARASTGPRTPPRAFLDRPLPALATSLIELDDLVRFVGHPVRAFLRQRLGIVIRDGEDDPADALPAELDKLAEWELGRRLLEARMGGADPVACRAAEVARGGLPPGALGAPIIERIGSVVDRLVAAATTLAGAACAPASVEVGVDLGGGRALVGTVPDVVGDRVRTVTYSRLAARHRLGAWVRLLALSAGHPGRAFEALSVGRGGHERVAVARVPAVGPEPAAAELRRLVDLYDRGMREPLPLYCKTSAAYAQQRAAGRAGEAAARGEWESTWGWEREDRELEHRLVLGGVVAFDALLAPPLRDDERGKEWAADEPSRFGCYARRLWAGLLTREQLETR